MKKYGEWEKEKQTRKGEIEEIHRRQKRSY
jgi:hypothetical protein